MNDECDGGDQAAYSDEPARYRFTHHYNERGNWCRFSHVAVSERLAKSDDRRCGHGCPDSDIEEIPASADGSAIVWEDTDEQRDRIGGLELRVLDGIATAVEAEEFRRLTAAHDAWIVQQPDYREMVAGLVGRGFPAEIFDEGPSEQQVIGWGEHNAEVDGGDFE
jgi:hypothetical protein